MIDTVRQSVPAIAFVGRSGSGKTTLIERIIAALCERGYRVGSVKHHSHNDFEIDHEGKDSWRHRKAGSIHTVIASPTQLASIRTLDRELEFDEIVANMEGLDIIVVEGYRHANLPTIELFREANRRDVDEASPIDTRETIAVVTDIAKRRDEARAAGLAYFDFEDIDGIVDYIEEQRMGRLN